MSPVSKARDAAGVPPGEQATFIEVLDRHIVFVREGTSGTRNRKPRGEMCESRGRAGLHSQAIPAWHAH
jgi:hypothetical protein